MRRGRSSFRWASALGLGLALAPGPAAATITGLCPDGSIFVVKREADIPCSTAKRVEPHEVPPIKPEFLPRPYVWEVFQQKQDPNNPYNLVDPARQVRGGEAEPEGASAPQDTAEPQDTQEPGSEPTTAVSAAPPPHEQLLLSPDEKRDLALIVELTQQRAPATFERSSGGVTALIVRLAYSRAFQARLHALRTDPDEALAGPVVLFSAEAVGPASFHANFTFAQGHAAFHPEPNDPRRFGLIEGALGPLAAGDTVLGYVVLPASVDLAQPMDIYWNDRRLEVTLHP